MQQVNLPKVTTTDDPINGIGSFAISNQPRTVTNQPTTSNMVNSTMATTPSFMDDNSSSIPAPLPQRVQQQPSMASSFPPQAARTPFSTPQSDSQNSSSSAPLDKSQDSDSDDDDDSNSTWNDPWASAWDDPWASGNKEKDKTKRLSPQERTEVIQKLYKEVLGREADTRDINYYKYSTLDEDEMRNQLLTGKEHKQLIDDGREYKQMKQRAEQSETRVKMLEAQVRDQVAEFKQVNELLQEKNRYINQLREQANNPYNFTNTAAFEKQLSYTHYSQSSQKSAPAPVQQRGESGNTTSVEAVPQTQPMIHHETIPTPSVDSQAGATNSASFSAPQFSKNVSPVRVEKKQERGAWDEFLYRMGKAIRNILNV